jgi:transcriptional regulator
MHPAPGFKQEDEAVLLAHLARYSFATIAAAPAGRPLVAHAPVLARRLEGGLVLDFHLSRGNALAPFLAEGFQAVAVSLAADAYVSPDWYETKGAVPTWNYASVEAEGLVTALDNDGLVALLDDLSALEEARLLPKPIWTRAKMAPGRFEAMCRSIIGARLTVDRLEGTFKLSQNKDEADRAGVMTALGGHPVAALMRAAIPPR